MCDTTERLKGSMTAARPSWWGLYARAGLMLAALLLVQVLVASGPELVGLQCALVMTGFVALAHWARQNRAELDRLEWCDCASSRVTVRVIPSRRGQLAHVEEADARAPLNVEPVTASLVDVAR
jgi:hypothetical protein